MVLLEEEEEGFVVEDDEGGLEEVDMRWCIVGKFVTAKNIKFSAMQVAMADLWKPVKGLCCKMVAPNIFTFQFFHELDMKRAVEGGPWTLDNAMLVWKPLAADVNPSRVELYEASFWVQLHDIPPRRRKEKVCEAAGKYLGKYEGSDDKNWKKEKERDNLRIRVATNVRKPLKRRMKLKWTGGEWFWIEFKYERLPSFCFICGVIGHDDRVCEMVYNNPALREAEKPYGVWLRAPSRRMTQTPMSQWLEIARDRD